MKTLTILLSLLSAISIATAQNWVAVYDSRRDEIPPFLGLIVDVADTDRVRNPDYFDLNERGHALRTFPTPYLLDTDTGAKVGFPSGSKAEKIEKAKERFEESLMEQHPEKAAKKAAKAYAKALKESAKDTKLNDKQRIAILEQQVSILTDQVFGDATP